MQRDRGCLYFGLIAASSLNICHLQRIIFHRLTFLGHDAAALSHWRNLLLRCPNLWLLFSHPSGFECFHTWLYYCFSNLITCCWIFPFAILLHLCCLHQPFQNNNFKFCDCYNKWWQIIDVYYTSLVWGRWDRRLVPVRSLNVRHSQPFSTLLFYLTCFLLYRFFVFCFFFCDWTNVCAPIYWLIPNVSATDFLLSFVVIFWKSIGFHVNEPKDKGNNAISFRVSVSLV